MIELPEARIIGRQMDEALKGNASPSATRAIRRYLGGSCYLCPTCQK